MTIGKQKMITKVIKNSNGNYIVSSCGKIINTSTKRELKQCLTRKGYLSVSIPYKSKDNKLKQRTKIVHRLVMEAFFGESDKQVNHKDGVKTNNKIENLEYCTLQENITHAREVLLSHLKEGGVSKMCPLDDMQILTILSIPSIKTREFSALYGVSGSIINNVRSHRSNKKFISFNKFEIKTKDRYGEFHHNSKITKDKYWKIMNDFIVKDIPKREVASKHNLGRVYLNDLLSGRSFRTEYASLMIAILKYKDQL